MAIPTNANKIVSSKSNTYFKANNITIGTAVPTKGTYAKGDIIISSSPNANAIGWICTTAGTPGSWKAIKSGVDVTSIAWNSVSSKPSTFTPTLGVTSSTAFRGDYGNAAYQHSQSDHAPSNAQKNSDITKAEIEAKLKGTITSHTHNYAGSSSAGGSANTAVKLATARKIGSASFDGTSDISIKSILGTVSTSGTNTTNKNKYSKFASVDVTYGNWCGCFGKLLFTATEANTGFNGTLYYYFRTGSTSESTSVYLTWETLNNLNYKNNVYAVKTANGKYDLYIKHIQDYSTEQITNIPILLNYGSITLISSSDFVDKITPAATSDITNNYALLNHTHKTITIQGNGTSLGTFNGGADKTINITASNIGAATSNHSHSNYAASSHSHGLLNSNFTKEISGSTGGWELINSTNKGYLLTSIRGGSSVPAWFDSAYSSGIIFGGSDTKGILSMSYSSPSITFAGGSSSPTWHMKITGSNNTTYNLNNYATKTELGDIQSILKEINGE